jgi:hypothetical protein
MKQNSIINFLIPLSIAIALLTVIFLVKPPKTRSANLTNAKATLSNSRLSYVAGAASGTSGQTLVTIDGSGNPDNNTNHLFPKDSVCFAPSSLSGCRDNTAYSVATVPSTTSFNTATALGTTLNAADLVVATQSGTLAVQFTLASDLPSNGDIYITIPMANSVNGNNYYPDYAASTAASGFDLGGIGTGNVSVTESCGGTFTVAAVNAGSGSTDHTIEINNSVGTCANGQQITVTVGDGTKKLINPAPITSGHVQGTADVYSVNVKTRDGSNNTLDESDVLIAPLEAVLLSATVDETLSFRVCGVDTDLTDNAGASCFTGPATICNLASLTVGTTPYAVPFGTMSTADSFVNAAQYVTAGTNADSGYAVTIEQNDQLGKNGIVCTGNPTDPVTTNCIPDNPGDGTLDYSNSDDCDTASNNGLCFSTDSLTGGTDPTFAVKYDIQSNDCDVSPTFCARSAADIEAGQTPSVMIQNNNPISGSDAFVCWRLSIDPIQPAGYYYNKVKYTATPIF